MNIASALIKQVLTLEDFETWTAVKKHYLPSEYHTLFNIIDKHAQKYHTLPSFQDLKFEIRDSSTLEKLALVEELEVDIDPYMLLEYIKNEYTQTEVLHRLDHFVENSIAFESADETLNHLHQIILDVESKVDLHDPAESMQRITLFADEEELEKYLPLGLNAEYDSEIKFSPRDLILVGGRRGSGKSVTCANVAHSVFESGKTAIYFTIEMDSRDTLQRICSVATGVPFGRLRTKNLSIEEWYKVASWWASRFTDGDERLQEYKDHRDFNKFHHELTTQHTLLPDRQYDIVYDPGLTLARIQAELDKKAKSGMDIGVVIVDYLNQVRRGSHAGQYDWTEQIEVSKALKTMAQDYEIPVFSPYQTDASGEARFAKGILDAADAAFKLETWDHEDGCITFECVKMRNAPMNSFTSAVDWNTLKIGPETALSPKERGNSEEAPEEEIEI